MLILLTTFRRDELANWRADENRPQRAFSLHERRAHFDTFVRGFLAHHEVSTGERLELERGERVAWITGPKTAFLLECAVPERYH
jgi:hypothetical protein